MGAVHRLGQPPKNLPIKRTMVYHRGGLDLESMVQWARENLRGPLQYDVVEFLSERSSRGRDYELTLWFRTNRDAQSFEERWIK